jgi:hypothetical protein
MDRQTKRKVEKCLNEIDKKEGERKVCKEEGRNREKME